MEDDERQHTSRRIDGCEARRYRVAEESTDALYLVNEDEEADFFVHSEANASKFLEHGDADEVHAAKPKAQGSSKYDFVKVRIDIKDHYYVFSRYLMCCALIATKVLPRDAVEIALRLKKKLVDESRLQITQDELIGFMYGVMRKFGYGRLHISRYRMLTRFHHKRMALVILIGGTGFIGKSSLATKLSERLNLSSVLQTDVVRLLMQTICE